MKKNRLWVVGLILVGVALLALVLQDVVYAHVLSPLTEGLWNLGLLYRSISQAAYWIILLIGIALIAFYSLYSRETGGGRVRSKKRPILGRIEELAWWMDKASRGEYFKWRLASRLAEVALAVLSRSEGLNENASNRTLAGKDWDPPEDVQAYLEAGLERFTRTGSGWWLIRRRASPVDLDFDKVIAYLEKQLELRSGHKHS